MLLGDGAIVDALRIRLGRPTPALQDWLETTFLPLVPPSVEHQLKELEQDVASLDEEDASVELAEAYRVIFRTGMQQLTEAMKPRLRPDTKVELAGTRPYPFSLKSSPLHRFMIAMLSNTDGTFRYTPTPKGSPYLAEGGIHIVNRHGTDEGRLVDSFPHVAEELRKTNLVRFDAPRMPMWSSAYFDRPSAPGAKTRRTFFFAHSRQVISAALAGRPLNWRVAIRGPLGFGIYLASSLMRAKELARQLLGEDDGAVAEVQLTGYIEHPVSFHAGTTFETEQYIGSLLKSQPFDLASSGDGAYCLYDLAKVTAVLEATQ